MNFWFSICMIARMVAPVIELLVFIWSAHRFCKLLKKFDMED